MEIETDLQGLADRVCKREIGGVGDTQPAVTVDRAIRDFFEERLLEAISQRADFLGVQKQVVRDEFGGFAEADDSGNVFGAGAAIAFVGGIPGHRCGYIPCQLFARSPSGRGGPDRNAPRGVTDLREPCRSARRADGRKVRFRPGL